LSAVAAHSFLLNDREVGVSRSAGAVLLDVLRNDLGLTGPKEGCREGDCGACLVLLGTPGPEGISYRAVNSCLLPLGDVAGRHVVTIEGLNQNGLSPVQKALLDEGAVQCGFCTPGLVVALTGFLLGGASLSEAEGIAALGGNICRCTGYASIKRAVARLCGQFAELSAAGGQGKAARIADLIARKVLPPYFLDIPDRLKGLGKTADAAGPLREREEKAPVLVSGGTDLFATQAEELRDAHLSFLSQREDLRVIRVESGLVRIGAATPLSEIESSPLLRRAVPDLVRHLPKVASPPIRHRATLAGNIVHASPAGDMSVMLLALEAIVILIRDKVRREIKLRDLFKSYKVLDMPPDELISEIRFPVPRAGTRFNFEKVARREYLDIAAISSAMKISVADGRIAEAHVSAGSAAPIPLYLKRASAFLEGKPVSAATAREAAAVAGGEISTIDDVRGSAEYRRALLPRLILAHFLALFPDRVREEELA
jgi:xanthine dehydrogenase small subunit